jgi:hypothetical protein
MVASLGEIKALVAEREIRDPIFAHSEGQPVHGLVPQGGRNGGQRLDPRAERCCMRNHDQEHRTSFSLAGEHPVCPGLFISACHWQGVQLNLGNDAVGGLDPARHEKGAIELLGGISKVAESYGSAIRLFHMTFIV